MAASVDDDGQRLGHHLGQAVGQHPAVRGSLDPVARALAHLCRCRHRPSRRIAPDAADRGLAAALPRRDGALFQFAVSAHDDGGRRERGPGGVCLGDRSAADCSDPGDEPSRGRPD